MIRPVTLKLTRLSCASMFPESFNSFSDRSLAEPLGIESDRRSHRDGRNHKNEK